jgi:hypothetical protein
MSAIEIQISARVHAPKNGRPITRAIVEAAVRRKAHDPEWSTPAIELRIVRWKHGGKWSENTHRDDTAEWVRFARFLPSATIIVESIAKVRSRRS